MAVLNPIKLVIDNYPEGKTETLFAEDLPGSGNTHEVPFSRELYIEREDFMETAPNNKYFRLAVGKEVRLKNAYIIECTGVEKDEDGNYTLIHCEYDPLSKTGDVNAGRKIKGTLHWVEANSAIKATVRMYDYLLKEFDGENRDFMDRLNENSLEILHSYIEPHILNAKAGDRFQFMRMGYFCCDEKEFSKDNVVMNKIVSLKDSFAKAMK